MEIVVLVFSFMIVLAVWAIPQEEVDNISKTLDEMKKKNK